MPDKPMPLLIGRRFPDAVQAKPKSSEELKAEELTGRDSIFADETPTTDRVAGVSGFRQIHFAQEELWATSQITGKGKFLTKLATKEAYRSQWKYVSKKGTTEPLSPEVENLIKKTDKQWKVRKTFVTAVSVARALGQCVICKVYMNPWTKKGPLVLKIAPYQEMDVEFDTNTAMPSYYNVYMKAEHRFMKVRVPAADCVPIVNDTDPFENGTIGTSELLATYFPIKWIMNIEEGYAKIILQRGLGLLDIKVTGADAPLLAKYEQEYGDPTQYSALLHDENIEIKVTPGVQQGHNITDTLKVYTREISSGCGIGENRLDGVQTYVTGAETDQDNYAAIGETIKEEFYDPQLATFALCEPKLKDAFEIEMPVEIRMDKMKEAELRSTEVGAIMAAPELFHVNTAMEKIGQPPLAGSEGTMSVAQYIAHQQDMYPTENFENVDDAPNENAEKDEKDKASQRFSNINVKDIVKAKNDRAKAIMAESDSISLNAVNAQIKQEFAGSGISMTGLVKIRGELDAAKQKLNDQ